MGQAQFSRSMTTSQLYDELEIHMKARRMEFKLVIVQLVNGISENIDKVLTDIILDYATRVYREKEFTRTEYLDIRKHIHGARENFIYSIHSSMGKTILALDSEADAARGLSSEFTVELRPPLHIDKDVDSRLALISSDMLYSRYNVTTENNLFRYWSGTEIIRIRIPPGAYNINLELRNQTTKER